MKTKPTPISETLISPVSRSLTLSLILLIVWGIQPSQAQTTGLWTWVSGSKSTNVSGVYGSKGVSAPTNMPGSRFDHSGGQGASNYFWIFGGTDGLGNYFNDLWTFVPSSGVWTWISGLNTANGAGVYGTKGVPAPGNMPGARYAQSGWTDHAGNIWIFGGIGYDGSGNNGYLNDLWRFNPSTLEWTWMSGSNTANSVGVYGTRNTPAAGNSPGAREYEGGWVDAAGNFWIFGGLGYAASGGGYLNDLWEYNSSSNLWVWVSGSNSASQPASYGTENVATATNIPSGRYAQSATADASGNFWIFGGRDNTGLKNDLWEYNPGIGEWTWISGGTSANSAGVYGSQGVTAPSNVPGSRVSTLWTDNSGNIWIFGGGGYATSGSSGDLNDVWEYSPASGQWTWMDGSDTVNPAGSYGTRGTAALSNQPPARQVNASWVDGSKNLWVMGGDGPSGTFNDLWEYNPIYVLSLQALTLEGTSKGNHKLLTWQTQGETNTASFEVERSTDGVEFSGIGNVASAGNGNNSYSFTDAEPPLQATLTYRIEAEDGNGDNSYSNVVGFSAATGGGTFVFPNPAAGGVTLQLGDANLLNTPARLLDIGGRLLGEQLITSQQQYIDLHELAGGVYFLQLTDGTTLKIIKRTGL